MIKPFSLLLQHFPPRLVGHFIQPKLILLHWLKSQHSNTSFVLLCWWKTSSIKDVFFNFKLKLRWDFGGTQNCARPSLPLYWDLQTPPLPKLQHYPSCWFRYYFFYPFLSTPFPSLPFPTHQRHSWMVSPTWPGGYDRTHLCHHRPHHQQEHPPCFLRIRHPHCGFHHFWSLLGRRTARYLGCPTRRHETRRCSDSTRVTQRHGSQVFGS